MSDSNFFFQERTQRWMEWDQDRQTWVYRDDLQPNLAPTGDRPIDDRSDQRDPRTIVDDGSSALQKQRRQASFGSEHGTSPHQHRGYVADDEVDQLADDFGRQILHRGGPSSSKPRPKDATLPKVTYGTLKREPKESFTDPYFLQHGLASHAKIEATDGEMELLDPGFMVQDNPSSFFSIGKVFRVLWPEHPGKTNPNVTVITDGKFINAKIVTKIRWFVVVKPGSNFCSCLPVSTYSRRGCGKRGVAKWQHSMIHTGRNQPAFLKGEDAAEGERPMMKSIRVEPTRRGDKMHAASRIDYSRVYTVEHYVKVKDFGNVHQGYVKRLREQWWHVFTKEGEFQSTEDVDEEPDDPDDDEEDPQQPRFKAFVTATTAFSQSKMMTLQVGDRIGVLNEMNEHWSLGINFRSNDEAMFPRAYTQPDS